MNRYQFSTKFVIPANSEQEARNKLNTVVASFRTPTQPGRFDRSGSSALSLLALTEHIHLVTGMPGIRVNDPHLPYLADMVEEKLAYLQTIPISVPVEQPEATLVDISEEEFARLTWIEVRPDDERYPGPDDAIPLPGGFSTREHAAMSTWTAFAMALNFLEVLNQYFPEDAVPKGMVRCSLEELGQVMHEVLGFPEQDYSNEWTTAKFAAVVWWAFRKSDYWRDKLETVSDVIHSLPMLSQQYEKYYVSLPEEKRPHNKRIGLPKERS